MRSGSAMSRRKASFVADWFGANRVPSAASTRHIPAVRRSCQPTPGATGSPVRASHTIVDARWFAMPTASTGPPSASAAVATASAASAISARVELDEARGRGRWAAPHDGARGRRSHQDGRSRRVRRSCRHRRRGCSRSLLGFVAQATADQAADRARHHREQGARQDAATTTRPRWSRTDAAHRSPCTNTKVTIAVTMPWTSGASTDCCRAATVAPTTSPASTKTASNDTAVDGLSLDDRVVERLPDERGGHADDQRDDDPGDRAQRDRASRPAHRRRTAMAARACRG